MQVEIHSRRAIEKIAEVPFEKSMALISIRDVESEPPKLMYNPQYSLYLDFDDIVPSDIYDTDYEERVKYAMRLFSEEQAKQIAEFVYKHIEEVDVVVCQCEYGQSRSAAVAAALKEHFDKEGITIYADDRYCPNNYIFRMTLKALNEWKKD